MTDFEPFDDDLAVALQRRAPQVGEATLGTANAHDAVLARARGIRRRRAGIAGLATLVAVIGAGVLLLNGGNRGDDTLAPATQPSTSPAPATSAVPSTSEVVVPATIAPQTTNGESLAPQSTTPTTPAAPVTTLPESTSTLPAATVVAQPPVSVGGQSAPTDPPAASTSSSSSSSSSTSSSSTSLAPQGPAPFTQWYGSAGGTIQVTWNGTALSLQAVSPADGETYEIEDNTATRIRVRFRGSIDSRIEIRYENGQVTQRID